MNVKIMNNAVLTKRNIPVSPSCSAERIDKALVLLRATPGVVKVVFDSQKRWLSIEYDLLTNSYTELENFLIKQGICQKGGIRLKVLSIWYDYLDSTARDNVLAPPASCCNKPPRRK